MKKPLLLSLVLACAQLAAAAEVVPVGDFRFLGGQYFFNGAPSSLSGNLSLTVTPAVKCSDRFSLVPTYMGAYRGTQEVNDLAGGGSLFQDAQTHLLSLKALYAATPRLRLKLVTSYRAEYLRETKNEGWGAGLYDYRKLSLGLEGEYRTPSRRSAQLGIDYYTLSFPNYRTMESQQSRELGRELAGARTLDSRNVMATAAFSGATGPVKADLNLRCTLRSYPDQPLVLKSGELSSDKRSDLSAAAGLSVTGTVRAAQGLTVLPALELQAVANDSNQAHYDARQTRYFAGYYDYTTLAVTPAVHLMIGGAPWVVSLSGSFSRQEYGSRPVQDAAGRYAGGTVSVNETVWSLSLVYPVAKDLKLRLMANYIDASSNMKYEDTFAYNYTSANYMTGFSYEF